MTAATFTRRLRRSGRGLLQRAPRVEQHLPRAIGLLAPDRYVAALPRFRAGVGRLTDREPDRALPRAGDRLPHELALGQQAVHRVVNRRALDASASPDHAALRIECGHPAVD